MKLKSIGSVMNLRNLSVECTSIIDREAELFERISRSVFTQLSYTFPLTHVYSKSLKLISNYISR